MPTKKIENGVLDGAVDNCYKDIMSKRKRQTVTDQLRAAIAECGHSQYVIAHATGVRATSLSRFMRGLTSMRLDRVDAVAEFLGLELTKKAEGR